MKARNLIFLVSYIHLNFPRIQADCKLSTKDGSKSQEHLDRLAPLKGMTFKYTFKDENDGDDYEYTFTICDVVDGYKDYAGIVQHGLTSNSNKVVGRINSTSVKAGSDWIMLTYKGGDKYGHHCVKAQRQAHVMISCDPTSLVGKFSVLYEENSAESEYDCFYMMELESSVACSTTQIGLSTGTILTIVLITIVGVYLIIGMAYQRCAHGARGVEQIPNFAFWKTCGSLQADGCDYLCRCQDSGFDSSRPYHGIADDQLDEEADDEHLLPM